MPPPAGEMIMSANQSETASRMFQTSRRRSHGLALGVLLVIGYVFGAGVLIRDYTAASPSVEQVA
jgi:hypothetical protein